jgi:parvulin-like peptidyl-prolyl isomerase
MPRFFLVPLALFLALLAAACGGGGGGSSVESGDAAVVDGEHISRATLDHQFDQLACSYKAQKRQFPKAGTAEYQALQSQVLQGLIQRAQLEQKAPSLKVTITDKQVDEQLKTLKKQYFGGSEKKYQAELERQCANNADVRDQVTARLLSAEIFKKLTASAKVTPAEVKAYYDDHRQVYTTPQTRVVSHILVKNKALADKLYAQLKNGASFAALAKKNSQDPGSKAQGGRLTITRGQTVPPFDRVAFELRTGQLSKPVHTQYGWHIIHADKPATPHKSTPFAQVKESIKQTLLQQKQNDAVQKWLDALKKEYDGKISYGSGLAPATTTTAAATTTG